VLRGKVGENNFIAWVPYIHIGIWVFAIVYQEWNVMHCVAAWMYELSAFLQDLGLVYADEKKVNPICPIPRYDTCLVNLPCSIFMSFVTYTPLSEEMSVQLCKIRVFFAHTSNYQVWDLYINLTFSTRYADFLFTCGSWYYRLDSELFEQDTNESATHRSLARSEPGPPWGSLALVSTIWALPRLAEIPEAPVDS
jgi:hypothetical protein